MSTPTSNPQPIPARKASIVISRKFLLGGVGVPFNIVIDGTHVGKVDNGKTVAIAVSPGMHKVYITIPVLGPMNRTKEITLDLTSTDNIQLTCGFRAPGGVFLQKS